MIERSFKGCYKPHEMQQRRLLLALVLSSAILFFVELFLSGSTAAQIKIRRDSFAGSQSGSPQQTPDASTAQAAPLPIPNVSAAPQRTITVRTPLYEAKFDTLGAEPVSWIIKFNKHNNRDIYSVGGRKEDKIPLELISPEGLKRQPRMVPLQLQTG